MAFTIKGLVSDGTLPSTAKADLANAINTPGSTVRAALDANGLGAGATDSGVAAYVSDTSSQTRAAIVPVVTSEVSTQAIPRTADASDTRAQVTKRLRITDAAGAKGSILDLEHFGDGTGHTSAQAYALDIHNNPGAKSAQVIHQYSNNGPALWLDNTGSAATIRILNTENQVKNPGSNGTGAFFEFRPWNAPGYFLLADDLTFQNNTGKNIKFVSGSATTTGNAFSFESGQNIGTVNIFKSGTGGGVPLYITNQGTGTALLMKQNGAGLGIRVDQAATGFYAMQLNGQDYGAQYKTVTNGGRALDVTKDGTGVGEGLRITNKGTGRSISLWNGTTEVGGINADGEYENLVAGKGVVVRTPNGTRARLTVGDDFTVTAVAA